MKKLNYLIMAALVAFMISCKEEDPPPLADPAITAPTGTTVLVNKTVDMSFTLDVPGKIAEVTVTTTDGTAVISSASLVGETAGIVTVGYTAPLTDGTETVTLTVKDSQTTPKTVTADASVAVTLAAEHTSELLVAKFASAPILDGSADDIWNTAQKLVGTATVPDAGSRGAADFNNDGSTPVPAGVFDPYTGESNDFTLRAGTNSDMIYFLLEWDDDVDSKDRQSWYFDATDSKWKGEHKYANTVDDKYYEDKFAFLWAATDVAGFAGNTCYATCHTGLTLANPTDKTARHYLTNSGEVVDMWHWKRVRCSVEPTVADDQQMIYKPGPYDSSSNGRTGDEGTSGYHGNSQKLLLDGTGTEVSVPLYFIPDATDYNWITKAQIDDGTAKMITAVATDGTLTYADGTGTGTIDPTDAGFVQATGNKRIPSVWVENFTGSKADIAVSANHTGTGWVVEFSRKLDTTHADDVKFDATKEFPFGLALFNNAAIAHEIKTNLLMKFEQ